MVARNAAKSVNAVASHAVCARQYAISPDAIRIAGALPAFSPADGVAIVRPTRRKKRDAGTRG